MMAKLASWQFSGFNDVKSRAVSGTYSIVGYLVFVGPPRRCWRISDWRLGRRWSGSAADEDLAQRGQLMVIGIRESSWCPLCRHWWHREVPPVTIKWASWRLSVFSGIKPIQLVLHQGMHGNLQVWIEWRMEHINLLGFLAPICHYICKLVCLLWMCCCLFWFLILNVVKIFINVYFVVYGK